MSLSVILSNCWAIFPNRVRQRIRQVDLNALGPHDRPDTALLISILSSQTGRAEMLLPWSLLHFRVGGMHLLR